MNHQSPDYDLLTKYTLGEASAEETRQVEEWVDASAENRKVLESLKQLSTATDFQSEPVSVDTEKAWNKLQSKMNKGKQGAKVIRMDTRSRATASYKRYFSMAAAIAGVLLVAAVLFRLVQNPTDSVQFVELTTTENTLTDTLPDGSVITLNKNSTMTYPVAFAEGARKVKLVGEAFFDVTKDSLHPFIIEAGDIEVKVLGTSFNVMAYAESQTISVIVESGRVQVTANKKEEVIVLSPGNKGTYSKSTAELSKRENDEVDYGVWQSRKLVFRNTPLVSVVKTINEYYQAGLSLENEAIGRCNFTATFQDDSLSTILDILANTFQLTIVERPNGKILSGEGCNQEHL